MKFLVLLFACLGLHVSSVSGFSTYVTTSGSTLNITTTDGSPHWYSGINLAPGAYLAGVDLFDTNLTDADLSNANLTVALLVNANLTGANLSGANLTGAIFDFATFTDANLTGANLTGAYLTGAILIGANLSGADLSGAELSGTELTDTNLYGAILPDGYDQDWFEEQGAIFVETVPEPSTYALLLGGTVLGYAFWRRRQ